MDTFFEDSDALQEKYPPIVEVNGVRVDPSKSGIFNIKTILGDKTVVDDGNTELLD